MSEFKIYPLAVACLLCVLVLSASVFVAAQEPVEFTGVVLAIEGQRLEIEDAEGERVWVTTEESLPADVLGKAITGRYVALGDTNLLVEATIDD